MTFQHLNFDQLSDLLDDEITDELKRDCLQHIAACQSCRMEYESLSRCLQLLLEVKNEPLLIPDICGKTISLYRTRKRNRMFYKTLPAIAASLMVITGAAFMGTGYFIPKEGALVAEAELIQNETQRIISSIRDADGRIIRMTGSYIEGAVQNKDLARLEKILQGSNIKYSFVKTSGYPASQQRGIKNIEDVDFRKGARPELLHRPVFPEASAPEGNSVIVRIFR